MKLKEQNKRIYMDSKNHHVIHFAISQKSILFQKVCLRWKLSPIINRQFGRLEQECPGWNPYMRLMYN